MDAFELKQRVLETLHRRTLAKTKKSKKGVVYYKYYFDGISIFVVCREDDFDICILTVIVKWGRE